jgi:hypothetical protein
MSRGESTNCPYPGPRRRGGQVSRGSEGEHV